MYLKTKKIRLDQLVYYMSTRISIIYSVIVLMNNIENKIKIHHRLNH